MTNHLDVVDAFADGECVAASDLEVALAHEDARAYLIDVLALRGLVTGARSQGAALAPAKQPPQRASLLKFAAAAALIIVGTGAGFLAGRGVGRAADFAQPVPTVVVTGGEPAQRTTAPAPTHVYRMENGVNWNEKAGGN